MKKNRIVLFVLLFVMGFSVVHAYAFDLLDHDRCSVHEFVQEVDQPVAHGDMCDMHFVYHMAYVLPGSLVIEPAPHPGTPFVTDAFFHSFDTKNTLYRPPIA